MRILFIVQNYLPFIGGVETQAQLIAQELATRHTVALAAGTFASCRYPRRLQVLHTSLLAPYRADAQDGPVPIHALTPHFVDRLRMLPIAARCLPGLRGRFYHSLLTSGYPWFRQVYLPRLRRLVRDADVVHSLAGGYLGWTAQDAACRENVPFLVTPYVHPHQWGDGPADVAYYHRSDAVIALLESDRSYLASLGLPAEKLHIVGVIPILPASVDPKGFRARHGLENQPVVLYVGRMMEKKGAKAILNAARQVWEQAPQTRFLFAGPHTPESPSWFEGADPRIVYLGKIDDQEKGDALAACTLFCMPSKSEILPAVYLEAWSSGKAVIGGTAEGLPELIEGNGAGLAVGHEPRELSAAITALLLDPQRREQMERNGYALVQRSYTREAVVGSLEALYRQEIQSRANARWLQGAGGMRVNK